MELVRCSTRYRELGSRATRWLFSPATTEASAFLTTGLLPERRVRYGKAAFVYRPSFAGPASFLLVAFPNSLQFQWTGPQPSWPRDKPNPILLTLWMASICCTRE